MRNIFLFGLLLLFFCPLLKADYGVCVVYYAQFYLKDGDSFKGYFECSLVDTGSYLKEGTNEYCSDEGVLKLFKAYQKENTLNGGDGGYWLRGNYSKVIVYKSLQILTPQKMKSNQLERVQYGGYGIVEEESIVFLDSTEIEKMQFVNAVLSKRGWFNSEIIVGDRSMIDAMKYQQYWNELFVDLNNSKPDSITFYGKGTDWGYHLINYNPNNNIAELKRLANLKLKFLTRPNPYWEALKEEEIITKKMQQMAREKFERDIQAVKDWFWERGIVMVRVNGTC